MVLEPDPMWRDKIIVWQEVAQQLHFNDQLVEMFNGVADGNPLTSKLAQRPRLDHVLHQENHSIPTSSQLTFLPEELPEESRTES